MDIRIEKAQPKHLPQLAVFAAENFSKNFGHLYKPEALAEHLLKTCSIAFFDKSLAGGEHISVALDGDIIVGYVKAGYLGLPVGTPELGSKELQRLYVGEAYQGKKIAHPLMKTALAALGPCPIYVGVWENNHRAQRFYAKYGFAPFSEYLYIVGDTADRELILRRPIP